VPAARIGIFSGTRGPATEPREARLVQNRIGRINHAILDNSVDIRSVRDVVNRIRIENDKISEIAVFDLADTRANVAAKEFCSVRRGALENLHWRQSGFFHQLKFAEKRRAKRLLLRVHIQLSEEE